MSIYLKDSNEILLDIMSSSSAQIVNKVPVPVHPDISIICGFENFFGAKRNERALELAEVMSANPRIVKRSNVM